MLQTWLGLSRLRVEHGEGHPTSSLPPLLQASKAPPIYWDKTAQAHLFSNSPSSGSCSSLASEKEEGGINLVFWQNHVLINLVVKVNFTISLSLSLSSIMSLDVWDVEAKNLFRSLSCMAHFCTWHFDSHRSAVIRHGRIQSKHASQREEQLGLFDTWRYRRLASATDLQVVGPEISRERDDSSTAAQYLDRIEQRCCQKRQEPPPATIQCHFQRQQIASAYEKATGEAPVDIPPVSENAGDEHRQRQSIEDFLLHSSGHSILEAGEFSR